MITVFTKEGFTDTWDAFLNDWQMGQTRRFAIRTYRDLADLSELAAGPVIFADIERLNNADRALAASVHTAISEARPDIPILNDPTRTLSRYDLLTVLYQQDLNPFRAYRLTDTFAPDRFPVFLRYESDHTGATTGLLHNQKQLNRAIVRVMIRQHDLRNLIIVEFIDTSDAGGVFAKFSTYNVAGSIVPRGVELSSEWVVKFGVGAKNPEQAAFAFDYVRDNPHEQLLKERFEIGGIDYGRIDYAMLGDSVVTWEINTNPTIMSTLENTHPTSLERQRLFLARFGDAFDALEALPIDPSPIDLSDVDQRLRADARRTPEATPSRSQILGRRYKRLLAPVASLAEVAAIPFHQQILSRWRQSNAL